MLSITKVLAATIFLLASPLLAHDGFQRFDDERAGRFVKGLYATNVLHENFVLKSFSFRFTDDLLFKRIADETAAFKAFAHSQIAEICVASAIREKQCDSTGEYIQASYPDSTRGSFISSYALALWFMKFDEDNWFSHARIHEAVSRYLEPSEPTESSLELVILKGFKPRRILTEAVAPNELPVVIDRKNKVLTFLVGDLFD